jgi:predicted Fe-S protein YdhL (DUF1289 family)
MADISPSSPCMNVCVLDADRCCTGCRRTLDEIARWGRMSAAEQWAVVARLDRLRAVEAHLIPVASLAAAR